MNPSQSYASNDENNILYELAISFDLNQKRLFGTAHLTLPPGQTLDLDFSEVNSTRILWQKNSSTPSIIKHEGITQLTIPPEAVQQELYISYEKEVIQQIDNYIEDSGIALLHSWFPLPSRHVIFSLAAETPEGFIAISESDDLVSKKNNITRFNFSKPLQAIHFIAAPFTITSMEVRKDLSVYTYLFEEDQQLADSYLKAAKDYLIRYETLIGQYPYNHFAIVENKRPTGYGMPTFTLLGQSVIRLPFIIKTSLGHEILHSWFGNSVEVKDDSGNWSEGLTSYLADWLYREEKEEGALNRKENIVKYLNNVTAETAVPLKTFRSASHYQPMAKSLRSTGYIRGAMVFHELRKFIGDEKFHEGIRSFYTNYRNKVAGWSDIETTFEAVAKVTLDSFFSERLKSTEIPDLQVKDVSVDSSGDATNLSFTLHQNTAKAFEFALPLQVETNIGIESFVHKVKADSEKITLQLSSPPNKLILDPEYDILRKLNDNEYRPTWSLFLGPRPSTVIIKEGDESMYRSFLKSFSRQKWEVTEEKTLKNSTLEDSNLIFLGTDSSPAKSLFGSVKHPSSGVTLDIRKHPLNHEKAVLLLTAESQDELEKVSRKLSHYGKYSYLHFLHGDINTKRIATGDMGIHHVLTSPPIAVPTKEVMSFDDTINALSESRVIYVGESHTSMTDHHLQYLIIESLYKKNKNIAIGLEMFPASNQESLDEYILGENDMNEKEFLKRSEYFKVWQYDFGYYKQIIDFAKSNNIPVVGLNIDRKIVSSIFKNGSPNQLTGDERKQVPQERDLGMVGYYQRLNSTHSLHMSGGHGKGKLSGFIQAQGVWDETMAQNIADFLQDNPEKQMIVLAGAQHTRKDSGIPPRVSRRIDVLQKTVLAKNNFSSPSSNHADYMIYLEEKKLPPSGKIGISLEEKKENDDTFVEIKGLVPQGNAGKSGLLPGDILVSINDYTIKTMEDIRISLVDARPKDIITVHVKRSADSTEPENKEFSVELYAPEKP